MITLKTDPFHLTNHKQVPYYDQQGQFATACDANWGRNCDEGVINFGNYTLKIADFVLFIFLLVFSPLVAPSLLKRWSYAGGAS